MTDRDRARTRIGGCAVRLLFLWLEVTIGIAIAYLVAEQLAPSLAARGYNMRIGAGPLIAMGLGAVVAIYPVIWLHRLGRRLAGRI